MSPMLLIGLIVVAVGSCGVAFMLFGQRTNPLRDATAATIPLNDGSATSGGAAPQLQPRTDDVTVRWYQRLRSVMLLVLITVGLGTAVGAVIGAVTLVAGMVLN